MTSNGHPFYFDWLQYEPPQSASVQNAVVYLDHLDTAIKYDSSWQALGGTANMTTIVGSKVTLDFIGMYLFLLQCIQTPTMTNRRHSAQLVWLHTNRALAQSFTRDICNRRPDHPNHVHFEGLNLSQFGHTLQPAIFPNTKVILFRPP